MTHQRVYNENTQTGQSKILWAWTWPMRHYTNYH